MPDDRLCDGDDERVVDADSLGRAIAAALASGAKLRFEIVPQDDGFCSLRFSVFDGGSQGWRWLVSQWIGPATNPSRLASNFLSTFEHAIGRVSKVFPQEMSDG